MAMVTSAGQLILQQLNKQALWILVGATGVIGAALLAYLLSDMTWTSQVAQRTALFAGLVVLAGYFPFPIGPRIKAGVTTAPLFGAALLLPVGAAALAAVVGTVSYQLLLRTRGEPELRLPWYKYPFNSGEVILSTTAGAAVFQALGGDIFSVVAVAGAAAAMFLANTGLVSVVVGVQIRMHPATIWWMSSREGSLVEVSLFAFGYLGAIAYNQLSWSLVALFIPVGIVYLAFKRLATANLLLEDALGEVKAMQGRLHNTAKVASIGTFAMDLAHQLRNPLFSVTGRLELLQAKVLHQRGLEEHVDAALVAAWRMQELLTGFVEAGNQRTVPVRLEQVLDDAVEMTQLGSEKELNILRRYQADLPCIQGYPLLLREAISNVFSNALEATPAGGTVTVDARGTEAIITIVISDNGTGIPLERQADLFQPFASSKPTGMGLGLFSAKHIVELHNGTIQLESQEGRGTTIEMTLPVNGHPDLAYAHGLEYLESIVADGVLPQSPYAETTRNN